MSLQPLDDQCRGSLLRGSRLRFYRRPTRTPVPGAVESSYHCGRNWVDCSGDGLVSSPLSIVLTKPHLWEAWDFGVVRFSTSA